jgi:tetratricopeptide (TPR) repeat protein
LNNYEQAEIYYQRAYRYNIQDYTLLKNIANTYYLRGNINEAIKYNERGYMRAPKDYNWLMGLAILYIEKKDNKKAVEYLDKALLLSPDNNELKKLKLEYSLFNLR